MKATEQYFPVVLFIEMKTVAARLIFLRSQISLAAMFVI